MKIIKSRLFILFAVIAACGYPGIIRADIPSDTTFSATYVKGYDADIAAGKPDAKEIGTVSTVDGISDKAIVVGEKGWLQYSLKGNIRQEDVPGSIEMWIKPIDWDGASTLGATLFSADYDNTGKKENERGIFRLYTQGNGRLTFIAGPYPKDDLKGQVWAQTSITDWKKGEWHHVVVSWDGVDIVIYIDGEQKARNRINIIEGGEDPRFKPTLGEYFTVGGSPWGSTGDTAIDEITIYKKALRPEEVSQRYRKKSDLIKKEISSSSDEPEKEKPFILPLPVSKKKPDIDGVIDRDEWGDATSINNFVTILIPERKLWPYSNRFYCKVVGKNLYIGLISEFNMMSPPAAEAESGSGKVFMDDCFEIFLTAAREKQQVYQIVVNSKGALDFYRNRPRGVLIPVHKVKAASSIFAKSWAAEIEIPLSEIIENFSGTLPERLFIQVSRSYKKGTIAEREQHQGSLGTEKSEEYSGFPWNLAFLETKNYAELVTVSEGQYISCDVDIEEFLSRNCLAVQGVIGKGWNISDVSLQAVWQDGKLSLTEKVAITDDGKYIYKKDIPDGYNIVRIESGEKFNIAIPVSQCPALILGYTIFSYNNTMEITLDIDGMAVPQDGFNAELAIKNAEGEEVEKKSLKLTSTRTKEVISIVQFPAGKYTVECSVSHPLQKTVLNAQRDFHIFRELPGKGLFDNLVEEVPAPWTPVEIDSRNRVNIWGRTYIFDNHLLPESIITQGEEILSAPIFYEVQLAGESPLKIEKGNIRILEKKPAVCKMETTSKSSQISIRQIVTIEYDGMMRFDVEVNSSKPITRLTLNVPYLKDRAKLFQAGAFRGKFTSYMMDAMEITPNFSWTSEYLYPTFWIADMHGGLSWFAATDRTWVVDVGREKIKVTDSGFIINFISTDTDTPSDINFTFGLQAFPTRPPREDWREFGRVLEGKWISVFTPDINVEKAVDGKVLPNYFTDILLNLHWARKLRGLLLPFCNFPRSVEEYTELPPDVYKRAVKELYDTLEQAKKAGYEYIVPYLTPTYATMAIPEWQFYWSNWIAIPKHIFENYGEPCVCVANKQWADFWLYSFNNYVKKYGIKGVFHDMALPYAEEGLLNGLGYEKNGIRYPEYPLWELRDIFKKTYIIHRKIFPDAMSFMNYGVFLPPIHSFCDFLLCGERYETRADRSIYDLDGDGNISRFTWQSSLPFGPKAMLNDWLKYQYAMEEKEPTVHLYGTVLLHDLVQWNINENPEVRKGIHLLKKRFGIGYNKEVEFLPYWDHEDKYDVDSGDVVISFYRYGQRLMAVLVNTRMKKTFQGKVELNLKKLGIENVEKIEIYDPLNNTYNSLKKEGGEGKLSINTEILPTLFKTVLINCDP